MPPCASGPVLMVRRPSLKGAACAMAGVGNLKVASAAPAAVAAMNLRRVTLRDIAFLPRVAPLFGAVRFKPRRVAFRPIGTAEFRHVGQMAPFRAAATAADRTAAIIGQCVPSCKARLRHCGTALRLAAIAAVGMARPLVLGLSRANALLTIFDEERRRWPTMEM